MFKIVQEVTARFLACKTYGTVTIPLPFKILVEKSQISGANLIITFKRIESNTEHHPTVPSAFSNQRASPYIQEEVLSPFLESKLHQAHPR